MLDNHTTYYSYNAKNQLLDVEDSGIITHYQYNYDGIRTGQTTGSDSTRDYAQVIQEQINGTQTVSYIHGDDLISQHRQGETRYYHYDGLGSTRALSDAAGTVTDSYAYEAFGELLQQTGSTENHNLFTGEQFDQNLNQYYLRARYYDPSSGRFTQMDEWMGNPLDPITLNKYLYADGDPVNFVDLSGRFASIREVGVVVGIIGVLTTATVNTLQFSSALDTSIDIGFSPRALGATVLTSLIVSDKEKTLICSLFSNILCNEDERLKDRPPGYWPGDKGAAEWGRRNGVGAQEGKRRFHKGIKQGDAVSGAKDDYSTNPDTGDVIDPSGEYAGNLEDDYD